jgi:hypothetical protein
MEILSLILGILGLLATLIGTYIAYISFINPLIRFKKYLKRPTNWEEVIAIKDHMEIYRYKNQPGYQIIIDWSETDFENYKADWIRDDYPNSRPNTARYIVLEANGIFLRKELFISLDNGRTFVPVPRIMSKNDERLYWYDSLQIQLANIIGKYSEEKNIKEFAANQHKTISINMDLL